MHGVMPVARQSSFSWRKWSRWRFEIKVGITPKSVAEKRNWIVIWSGKFRTPDVVISRACQIKDVDVILYSVNSFCNSIGNKKYKTLMTLDNEWGIRRTRDRYLVSPWGFQSRKEEEEKKLSKIHWPKCPWKWFKGN